MNSYCTVRIHLKDILPWGFKKIAATSKSHSKHLGPFKNFWSRPLSKFFLKKYFWAFDHFWLFQNTPQKLIFWIFTNATMSDEENNKKTMKYCGNATKHCPETFQKKLQKIIFRSRTYENFKINKSWKNVEKKWFFGGKVPNFNFSFFKIF